MPRSRFSWDRLADYHVILAFAATLLLADVACALMLWHFSGSAAVSTSGFTGLLVAFTLGAVSLAGWALMVRQRDQTRRAKFDRVVDTELTGKWDPGFASMLGIYDKPWYILCGETAVGKTAALRAANLPMAIGPDGRPITDANQGKNGTFMFDWWFFKDAVVFDSAGDLIENPDGRWLGFLQNVREARPIQPINGMILAVSALDLMGDPASLRRKADLLARQVEVARNELRVRFPLYILVTKSDLITGFADYFPMLADLKSSFQIVGWSNSHDPRMNDVPTTRQDVRVGLEELSESLRQRRSARLRRTFSPRESAQHRIDHLDEMFAFPAAVSSMLSNLEEFVGKLLDRVGTVTPPFMRGIYFTSALQTGQALDFELQKALGVERLPESRRGATDRAYFIRDLFLEKIIPESGMVTPLEDVVTATRHRGRALVAGSFAAAAVVLIGSAVGYVQTTSRIRPHKQLWEQLAGAADHNDLDKLEPFDESGHYRGNSPVPASMQAGSSISITQMHRDALNLTRQNPPTVLLPVTNGVNDNAVTIQHKLFVDRVFLPAFRPMLHAPEPGIYSDEKINLLCSTLALLTQPGKTVTYADLIEPAKKSAAMGGADERFAQLLNDWISGDGGSHAMDLPGEKAPLTLTVQQSLADFIDAQARQLQRNVESRKQFLGQVRELVDKEQVDLNDKIIPASLSEKQTADLREITGKNWNVQISEKAALQADLNMGEIQQIQSLLVSIGDAGPLGEALARLKARQESMNGEVTGVVANRPEAYQEFLKSNVGADPKAPLIAQRLSWYQMFSDSLTKWVPSLEAGPVVHPFFDIRRLLAEIKSKSESERQLIDQQLNADPSTGLGFPTLFKDVCSQNLVQVQHDRQLKAVEKALAKPDTVWMNAKGTKPDYTITYKFADGTLERSASPDIQLDVLKNWMQNYEEGVKAIRAVVPENTPDRDEAAKIKVTLKQIENGLLSYENDYANAWSNAVGQLENPHLDSWEQIQWINTFEKQQKMQEKLLQNLHDIRSALNALPGQHLTPDLDADFPSDTARASKECAMIQNWVADPVTTRLNILTSAADIDKQQRQMPDISATDKFWEKTAAEAVNVLVKSSSQSVRSKLKTIHDATESRFPFCQNASAEWKQDNIASILTTLNQFYPPGCENLTDAGTIRIRDLGTGEDALIGTDWHNYIAWLRHLDTILSSSSKCTLTFAKPNEQGHWMAVAVQGNGKNEAWAPVAYEYDPAASRNIAKVELLSGRSLQSGLKIRLVESNQVKENDIDTSKIDSASWDCTQPWSILRLLMMPEESLGHPVAIMDLHDNVAKQMMIQVDFGGTRIKTSEVPLHVP